MPRLCGFTQGVHLEAVVKESEVQVAVLGGVAEVVLSEFVLDMTRVYFVLLLFNVSRLAAPPGRTRARHDSLSSRQLPARRKLLALVQLRLCDLTYNYIEHNKSSQLLIFSKVYL
jgi:hypothetical protein